MFTGIIESTGILKSITEVGGDVRLTIESDNLDFNDVKLGDSIASNGICLTVVEMSNNSYSVDVSRETLAKTAMGNWQQGDTLNLEKAMLPTTRFGGHMVSGHVPHTAEVTNIGRHWKVGGPVNIEVDLIARYLERLTSVAAE